MKSKKRKTSTKKKVFLRRTNKRKNKYFGGVPKREDAEKTLKDALSQFSQITPFYLKKENAEKITTELNKNQTKIKDAALVMVKSWKTFYPHLYEGERNSNGFPNGIGLMFEAQVIQTQNGFEDKKLWDIIIDKYYYGNFVNNKKQGAGIMFTTSYVNFGKNTPTLNMKDYFIGNWRNDIIDGIGYNGKSKLLSEYKIDQVNPQKLELEQEA